VRCRHLPVFDTKQADACVLRRRVLIKTWPTVFKLQLKSSWRKLRTPSFATKATVSGHYASPNARDRTAPVNFPLLVVRTPRLLWPRPERCRTDHLWRGPAETEGSRSSTNRAGAGMRSGCSPIRPPAAFVSPAARSNRVRRLRNWPQLHWSWSRRSRRTSGPESPAGFLWFACSRLAVA
jgi:hypothetical protein